MISLGEASDKLGVDEDILRKFLHSGIVVDEDGSSLWYPSRYSWVIGGDESFVSDVSDTLGDNGYDDLIGRAHALYGEASELASLLMDNAVLDNASCGEEEEFWLSVASFFLEKRQLSLIGNGTF